MLVKKLRQNSNFGLGHNFTKPIVKHGFIESKAMNN